MPQDQKNIQERLFSLETPEKAPEQKSPELIQTQSTLGESLEGTLDTLHLGESVSEKATEKPSEVKPVGHKQVQTSQDLKQAAKVKESPDEVRRKLLEKMPKETVMRHEIQSKIHQEIKILLKEANKAGKQGNAFKMNILVKKIRELSDIIASLAHLAYEALKNLWLKVVHGITP